MKEKIAIICGGDTSEFEVSLRSAQGLYDAMDKTLFEPHIVIFRGTHWFLRTGDGNEVEMDKNDFSAMVGGRRIAFRYAYVTIHGTPGEDGRLQGYLDMMRIKYSTGGVLSLALTHDKYPCNQYLRAFGIPVAASVCLYEGQAADCADILAVTGLPCFVKPSLGGSSYGISKVKTADELPAALEKAFHESDKVVVEACLVGTELTCGAYKTRKTQRAFPVTEVVTHNEFFDYDAKYNGQVDEITPARISEDLSDRIKELTLRIYDLVMAQGIIRVDYIVAADGTPYVLEVNTTPGMTATSFIPQQVRADGRSLTDVLTEIIMDKLEE